MYEGLTGESFQSGKILHVEREAYHRPKFSSRIDERAVSRLHSVLCVPLKPGRNGLSGVLQLSNKHRERHTREGERGPGASESERAIGLTPSCACAPFSPMDIHFAQRLSLILSTVLGESEGMWRERKRFERAEKGLRGVRKQMSKISRTNKIHSCVRKARLYLDKKVYLSLSHRDTMGSHSQAARLIPRQTTKNPASGSPSSSHLLLRSLFRAISLLPLSRTIPFLEKSTLFLYQDTIPKKAGDKETTSMGERKNALFTLSCLSSMDEKLRGRERERERESYQESTEQHEVFSYLTPHEGPLYEAMSSRETVLLVHETGVNEGPESPINPSITSEEEREKIETEMGLNMEDMGSFPPASYPSTPSFFPRRSNRLSPVLHSAEGEGESDKSESESEGEHEGRTTVREDRGENERKGGNIRHESDRGERKVLRKSKRLTHGGEEGVNKAKKEREITFTVCSPIIEYVSGKGREKAGEGERERDVDLLSNQPFKEWGEKKGKKRVIGVFRCSGRLSSSSSSSSSSFGPSVPLDYVEQVTVPVIEGLLSTHLSSLIHSCLSMDRHRETNSTLTTQLSHAQRRMKALSSLDERLMGVRALVNRVNLSPVLRFPRGFHSSLSHSPCSPLSRSHVDSQRWIESFLLKEEKERFGAISGSSQEKTETVSINERRKEEKDSNEIRRGDMELREGKEGHRREQGERSRSSLFHLTSLLEREAPLILSAESVTLFLCDSHELWAYTSDFKGQRERESERVRHTSVRGRFYHRYPRSKGLIGKVMSSGVPLRLDSARNDSSFHPQIDLIFLEREREKDERGDNEGKEGRESSKPQNNLRSVMVYPICAKDTDGKGSRRGCQSATKGRERKETERGEKERERARQRTERGDVIGVIQVANKIGSGGVFTQEDENLLSVISASVRSFLLYTSALSIAQHRSVRLSRNTADAQKKLQSVSLSHARLQTRLTGLERVIKAFSAGDQRADSQNQTETGVREVGKGEEGDVLAFYHHLFARVREQASIVFGKTASVRFYLFDERRNELWTSQRVNGRLQRIARPSTPATLQTSPWMAQESGNVSILSARADGKNKLVTLPLTSPLASLSASPAAKRRKELLGVIDIDTGLEGKERAEIERNGGFGEGEKVASFLSFLSPLFAQMVVREIELTHSRFHARAARALLASDASHSRRYADLFQRIERLWWGSRDNHLGTKIDKERETERGKGLRKHRGRLRGFGGVQSVEDVLIRFAIETRDMLEPRVVREVSLYVVERDGNRDSNGETRGKVEREKCGEMDDFEVERIGREQLWTYDPSGQRVGVGSHREKGKHGHVLKCLVRFIA